MAKQAKSLGERVAEKWYTEGTMVDASLKKQLAALIDLEAKKMSRGRTIDAAAKWWVAFEAAAIREARASCALDGETQCDPNDIPKPKKVRRRK